MIENLKLKFNNYKKIDKNYSQAHQDLFVLSCLDGKEDGFFLELGSNDPIMYSNSFLLEDRFNWNGISIDIADDFVKLSKEKRKCKSICEDCTKINYIDLLGDIGHVDYLSLDLDPASITLDCLKIIPFDKVEFSVITYEHDYYRFKDNCRQESRDLLEKYGYYLLCSNVKTSGLVFEDWYINKKYVDFERVKIFKSDNLESSNIILR